MLSALCLSDWDLPITLKDNEMLWRSLHHWMWLTRYVSFAECITLITLHWKLYWLLFWNLRWTVPWTLIHWSNQNTVFNLNAVHSALSIISVQAMTLSSEGDQLRYAYYIMPLCYYFMFRKKTCLQICRCRIEQWIKNKSSDKYLLVSEAFGCSASHVEAFMNTLSLSSTGG